MDGWLFFIIFSTLVIMPIYRKVMRQSANKITAFVSVAIPSSLIALVLLRMDPRGIEGPGYFVIFLFGPLTIGWICNGVLNLIEVFANKYSTNHPSD
jgi:hypothetical protein